MAHSKSRVAETETELLAEEAALSEAFADKERLEERTAEMKATERTRRDSLLGVNENTTRIEAVQDDLRTRMHAVELEMRECQTNR
ncbi:MAG: hypothetical protein QF662_07590, partial [Phycisphaerae bacterium]|nr:hypothetical protein [Phycisphaerae bacterium]